jgi:hypothetical protein
MKIIGQLLDIEPVKAYVDNKTGEVVRPAYPRLYVLDGRESVKVEVREFDGTLPTVGQTVDVEVRPRCYVSRGDANMVFDFVRFNPVAAAEARKAS